MNNEKPVAGMAATYHIGSDCYPMTIIRATPSGKTLWARRCRPSPDGSFQEILGAKLDRYSLREDGRYRPTGQKCGYLELGVRHYYQDPGF